MNHGENGVKLELGGEEQRRKKWPARGRDDELYRKIFSPS
jgi:hypothetical protein